MSVSKEAIKYKPFSNKKMLAYSLGFFILNMMWAIRNKIQLYGQKALGISIPMIFLIIVIYSVWDAVNDPLSGYLLDRSSRFTSRFGKRFPFIMIGLIGASLSLILLYLPITNDPVLTIVWLLFVLILYDALQTLFELGSGSFGVDLFRDQKQRVKYGSYSHIIGGIGSLLAGFLPVIILGMFGGETNATAYLMMAIIITILFLILAIPFGWSVHEPAEMRDFRTRLNDEGKSSSPLKEFLIKAFKDRNWVGFLIAYIAWVVSITCVSVGIDFFVIDTLGLPIGMSALPQISFLLVSFITIPIWMKIARKYGTKTTYFYALISTVIGGAIFIFAVDLPSAILLSAIGGIGHGGQGLILTAVYSEAIDNATVKSGVREESSYLGIMRFFGATGVTWQILIFMIVAAITGYNPTLGTANTDFAKIGLNVQMSIIPAIISLIATLIFFKMNVITKDIAIANKEKLIEMDL